MPINFPYPPSLNQLYSYDGKTWEWNGIYWEVYSALTSYITSAYTSGDGYSSISGVTGGNIVLKSFSGVNITITDSGNKLTFSASTTSSSVSGEYLPLSGGTVTGNTIFQSGLTANTVSATTYYNLPVSGLTNGSGISITNNNNNFTITYTGSTGNFLPLSGGTVTGGTLFQSGLTANTLTTFTTGFTHNNSIGVDRYSGEVIKFGAGNTSASTLYYYSSGNWSLTDANSTTTSTKMLGIGISPNYTTSGNPSTDGILVRGYARLYYPGTWNDGDILYVADNNLGLITNIAPTTSTYVVRIIGYVVDGSTNLIYFCPDNTWVELV